MKVLNSSSIYITFLILISLFSCSDKNEELLASYETSEISFNIPFAQTPSVNLKQSSGLSNVSSVSGFTGTATIPSYVKEIKITAIHKTYKNDDGTPLTVSKIFVVNDGVTGFKKLPTLELPLGKNLIKVETVPQEDDMGQLLVGYNKAYYNIPICPASTSKAARVRYYSDILSKKQTTYFEYIGTKEINVELKNTNVSVNMTTPQSRLNIVFENISKYPSAYIVNYVNLGLCYIQMPIVGTKTASACVLNRADLSENSLEVCVKCFDPDTSGDFSHLYMIYSNLKTAAGVNRTVVFRLNRNKEP
ncbi:MAG: hypothetical protein WBG43_11700 [Marinifilaceae bacterium]